MGNVRLFITDDVLTIMRAEMLQMRMTQEEYAEHVGCSPGYLSKIMRKKNPPSGAVLAHLRLKHVDAFEIYDHSIE